MARLTEVQITSRSGFTTWTVRPGDIIAYEDSDSDFVRPELHVTAINVHPDPNPFIMKDTVWLSGTDNDGNERHVAAYAMTDWLGR